MARQIKRTKKGRFAKGTGPGPGKKARKDSPVPTTQEIRDAFYKAFTEMFVKGGNIKELVAFCKKNQLNQRLLIQEVRKMLPEMTEGPQDRPMTVIIERRYTDDRSKLIEGPSDKDLEEMKGEAYMLSDEFMPRPTKSLPKKEKDPDEMTDKELQERIKELEEKKAGILAALAEKRPDKSKAVN